MRRVLLLAVLTILLVATITQILVQPLGAVLATKMRNWSRAVTIMLVPEIALMPLMFVLIRTENYWLSMFGVVRAR